MNIDIDEFWNRIKIMIKKEKLTQESFAEKCNIKPATLQSWITRQRLPDAFDTYKIAQALNTTVEYLVTGKETNPYAEENKILKEKLSSIQKLLNE